MLNKEQILGLVRHLLTFIGGYVVATGGVESVDWDTGVGALMTLVGLAWSYWDKTNRVG